MGLATIDAAGEAKDSDARGREVIRGSAQGARAFAVAVWTLCSFCVAVDALNNGWSPIDQLPALAVAFAIGVRPWFMGVEVTKGEIVVRSWFRSYRYRREDIVAVSHTGYSGMLNRLNDEGWYDPLSGWGQILAIRTATGDRRAFPGTLSSRKRMARTVESLRRACDIAQPRSPSHARRD